MSGLNYIWSLIQLFVLLSFIQQSSQQQQGLCLQNIDLVFALDASGSVKEAGFKQIKEFTKAIVRDFNIGVDKTHVGVVVFSEAGEVQISLTDSFEKNDILSRIDNLDYHGYRTATDDALRVVNTRMFSLAGGARQGVAQVLIFLTDGKCTICEEEIETAVAPLKEKGVNIFTVGVTENINRTELETIASEPVGEHMFEVDSFGGLASIIVQLYNKGCSGTKVGKCSKPLPPFQCTSSEEDVCFYDGDCPDVQKCCSDGCSRKCAYPILNCLSSMDIGFALDSSNSVKESAFVEMKNVANKLVDSFQVSQLESRFSAMTYSSDAEVNFNFVQYNTAEEVKKAIKNLPHKKSNTRIDKALQLAQSDIFSLVGNVRSRKPMVLIVFYDGDVSRDMKDLAEISAPLKTYGVKIIAIGVGPEVNTYQLKKVASSESVIFEGKTFNEILPKLYTIAEEACSEKPGKCDVIIKEPGDNVNCKVGEVGECQTDFDCYGNAKCCKQGCTSKCVNTNTVCQRKIDIAFGLHDNLKADELDAAKYFLKSTLQRFEIARGKSHAALMQFGKTSNLVFDFNSVQDLGGAMTRQIDNVIIKGSGEGRLVDALELVRDKMFCEVGGTRETVPKMFVLITGESAVSDSANLQEVIRTLRSRGVDIITIGVGNIDVGVLQKITSDNSTIENRVFLAQNYAEILQYSEEIATFACSEAGLVVSPGNSTKCEGTKECIKGEKGPTGRPGPMGSKGVGGEEGPRGNKGMKGRIGPRGDDGTPGVNGDQGPKGLPGIVGYKGYAGNPGYQGMTGPAGFDGNCGIPGDAGDTGDFGIGGFQGPPGDIGLPGIKGVKGQPVPFNPNLKIRPGSDGDPGEDGRGGKKGPLGEDGGDGLPGDYGVNGKTGAQGPAGDPGDPGIYKNVIKGEKGDPGDYGAEGTAGTIVVNVKEKRGKRGDTGSRGVDGDVGMPGKDSTEPGIQGKDGSQGDKGTKGAFGESGPPGLPGIEGELGKLGEQGDKGKQGYPGIAGRTGQSGDIGPKGMPGEQGMRGETPTVEDALGQQGKKGIAGDKGINGFAGDRGLQGELGPKGVQGDRGQIGPVGDDGPVGGRGNPGAGGIPGSDGTRGDTGLKGELGDFGARGDDGTPGELIQGTPGFRGSLGIEGVKGSTGDPGEPGQAGEKTVVNCVEKKCPVQWKGKVGAPGLTGPNGSPGDAGDEGPKGAPGNKCPICAPGESGQSGEMGSLGKPGPQGPRGNDGDPGGVGMSGETGLFGRQGPKGLKGILGIKGAIGPLGKKGEPAPGDISRAEKGDKGFSGSHGFAGRTGKTGIKGELGRKGATGGRGRQGAEGSKGMIGSTGIKGRPGNSANKGEKGSVGDGERGILGDRGNTGPQGKSGLLGEVGEKGRKGQAGREPTEEEKQRMKDLLPGEPGAQGERGDPGVVGIAGPVGPKGNYGRKGLAGSKGLQGPGGVKGGTGFKGRAGNDGNPGPEGFPGRAGKRGPPGEPGKVGKSGDEAIKGQKGDRGDAGVDGKKGPDSNLTASCISDSIFDIAFLLDSSKSVNEDDFNRQKEFIRDILKQFPLSASGSRAGFIKYGANARIEMRFNDYTEADDVLNALERIEHNKADESRLDVALQIAKDELFTEKNGARLKDQRIKQALVILGDGFISGGGKLSSELSQNAIDYADALKSDGVLVFSLAVGAEKNSLLLQRFVSTSNYYLNVQRYSVLHEKIGDLKQYFAALSNLCKTTKGEKGQPGKPGPQGEQGMAGEKGLRGEERQGKTGLPGLQGRKGEPGNAVRGSFGSNGPKGTRGDAGFPGIGGETVKGKVGKNGPKGFPGDGIQGIKGEAGDQGDIGPVGQDAQQKLCDYVLATDIIILLDSSIGVGVENFEKMKVFVQNIVKSFDVDNKMTRVAIMTYDRIVRVEIKFSDHTTQASLLQNIESLSFVGGSATRIDLALQKAADVAFSAAYGARDNVNKAIVLMTDGQQSYAEDQIELPTAVQPLADKGVLRYAIGIGNEISKVELEVVAGDNVVLADNFNALLSKIELQISIIAKRGCKGDDGFPGRRGEPGEDGFRGFGGPPGATGKQGPTGGKGKKGEKGERGPSEGLGSKGMKGEQGKEGPRGLPGCRDTNQNVATDLGFIIDASASLYAEGFQNEIKFVNDVIEAVGPISAGGLRAGAVVYSDVARIRIKMDDHFNTRDFQSAIRSVPYDNMGSTRIDLGFEKAKELFAIENGARGSSKKVLILLTDGQQSYVPDIKDPRDIAQDLIQDGIEIFSLGIGAEIDRTELESFISKPEYVFLASDLNALVDRLVNEISQALTCEGGPRGITGDPGEPGPFGSQGLKGPAGEPGINGQRGEDGFGPRGDSGDKGQTGVFGDVGDKGFRGTNGKIGKRGPIGPKGITGSPGLKGDEGEFGFFGEPGPQGPPGLKGIRGDSIGEGKPGDQGQRGDKGEKGYRGEPGVLPLGNVIGDFKGDRGLSGGKGQVGKKGEPGKVKTAPGVEGLRGLKGVKSNVTGVFGPRGEEGDQGFRGIKGLKGFPGDKGLSGDNGFPGIKGQDGVKGILGENGVGFPGDDGQKGEAGPDGDKGPEGLVGFIGLFGDHGDKGDTGEQGKPGRQQQRNRDEEIKGFPGDNGFKGDFGLDGEPGDPGPTIAGQTGLNGDKGSVGESGAQGPKGYPGRSGGTGLEGRKGEKGRVGGDGDPGDEGPKGSPGDMGKIIGGGEFGEFGDIGLEGLKGRPGLQGLDGDIGYKGSPGPSGEKGVPGEQGFVGKMGADGEFGKGGGKGQQGDQGQQGSEGPQGPQGKSATANELGHYVVRHSQTADVPKCPRDYQVLWEGYSLMYTVGNGNAHSQDLGDPGSCTRSFNSLPYVFCDITRTCKYASRNDFTYWLSGDTQQPMMPVSGSAIEPLISRCVVCEAPDIHMAVHSQDVNTPECPHGYFSLWSGYSFMMVAGAGKSGAGQSLSSSGSCLEEFRPKPFVECQGARGSCHFFSDKYSFWLVTIDETKQFEEQNSVTLKGKDMVSRVSKCRVCMRSAGDSTNRPEAGLIRRVARSLKKWFT